MLPCAPAALVKWGYAEISNLRSEKNRDDHLVKITLIRAPTFAKAMEDFKVLAVQRAAARAERDKARAAEAKDSEAKADETPAVKRTLPAATSTPSEAAVEV